MAARAVFDLAGMLRLQEAQLHRQSAGRDFEAAAPHVAAHNPGIPQHGYLRSLYSIINASTLRAGRRGPERGARTIVSRNHPVPSPTEFLCRSGRRQAIAAVSTMCEPLSGRA
jgi:hypothetical protein